MLYNNTIVTENIKENSAGIDVDENEYITIQFSKQQIIDSVVILPDSNVNSYSISYTKPNGDEYILEEVNRRHEFLFCIDKNILLIK